MPNWKLTLEYDGTRYRGWQTQKNTDRTVQGVLSHAASELFEEDVGLGGAGRTDAGVHALAQVAHLRTSRKLAERAIREGLNDRLPFDVNVLEVEPASASFHARHDARSRTYLYRISRRRTAFEKRLVWWIRDPLDADAMGKAAALLPGRHDFASFCENAEGQQSTEVVVEKAEVIEVGPELHFRITASHFLWKMVRRLAGTLVEVGRGNLSESDLARLLATRSGDPAQWTAPPSGLFLERVDYASAPKGTARKGGRRDESVEPSPEISSVHGSRTGRPWFAGTSKHRTSRRPR